MPANPAQASDEADPLPDSIRALRDGVRRRWAGSVEPGLFEDPAVLAAERAQLFGRFWVIADFVNRLEADGRFFTIDTGARSLIITREAPDRLHALRNLCLHAGYPVCEEAEGQGEQLHCLYHDWLYALDGRLVSPALSAERFDPARLRLAAYPLILRRGLILVDPSGAAPPPLPESEATLPDWFENAVVTGRDSISVERNWKELHCGLRAAPETLLGGPGSIVAHGFGPLNLAVADAERAILFRIIPKAPQRTHLAAIHLTKTAAAPDTQDGLGEAVAAVPVRALDREFLLWYAAAFG